MKENIKQYPVPAVILALLTVTLLIFGIANPGRLMQLTGKLFTAVVAVFDKGYKIEIAYPIAIMVMVGLLILLVKNLLGRTKIHQTLAPLWETVRDGVQSYKDHKRNKAISRAVAVLAVIVSVLLIKTVNFPFAFLFTGVVVIYYQLKNRTQPVVSLLLVLMVLLLFLAPYVFQGQGIHMKISDVMDAWVPQQKVLAESGSAFSLNPKTEIANFINGIRISGFVNSGYNVITILFMIFPPFTAFAINVFIMAITAFWGMRILLLKYVGKETGEEDEKGKESSDAEKHRVWIITGVSLCFAMLPFYPSGGLSIAGLPLLVYSYLNIKNNESSKKEYLYIALYPFYSVLPFAGMFVIMALFVIFVIDTLKKRRIHTIYIAVLTGMSLLYLLTHFHMIYSILDPEFVSYREELKILPMSFAACFKTFIHNIIYDKSNIIQAQRVFVMIAAAGAVYLGIKRNIKQSKILMYMLLFTVFNAFLWGFKYWQGIHFLREKYQVLNALNLARFYWLNPFLWSVVFALSLLIISKIKKGKAIATFLLMGQVVFMFTHYNWEYRSMSGWKNPVPYSLSYGEYYSEGLFEEIGQYIGKPRADYRVASIGLPAGIAQYNGFYTLDIFSNVYPLEYKHRFREIIAKELEKSARVKRAFDENGKRCYLTPAEIQGKRKIIGLALARGLTKKEQRIKIKNLEINTEAFGKMGGEYIISAVEIRNYKANQLTFEKIFENNKSPWKIYLYKRKAT